MDLNQLAEKAQKTREKIIAEWNKIPVLIPWSANSAEEFIKGLENFKSCIILELTMLHCALNAYNRDKNAPKRAQARDLCDKILQPLDAVRDILARSIDGDDDDVVCNEEDAERISGLLEAVTPILPQISNLAYVKRGGKQSEDNNA